MPCSICAIRIFNLGMKDFSLPGNEIDPNDQDGEIRLRNVPVMGLCQPDTIAAYEHRGQSYLVMANEGDARDNPSGDSEDERRGSAGNASVWSTCQTAVNSAGRRCRTSTPCAAGRS